jgi:hypothetical protein
MACNREWLLNGRKVTLPAIIWIAEIHIRTFKEDPPDE